jgi:hypothetical protein
MPFSAEEWRQTPPAVQEFVLSLLARVEALEAEVVELREQLNRNSGNSSQPPDINMSGLLYNEASPVNANCGVKAPSFIAAL